MSQYSNDIKSNFLGMPFGTAGGKLRKMILFHLLKKHNENFCFRCGAEIETIEHLSIEHKKPWLHENVELFWDMENIAFSHLSCNSKDARQTRIIQFSEHGTKKRHRQGCRCELCNRANAENAKRARMNARVVKLADTLDSKSNG